MQITQLFGVFIFLFVNQAAGNYPTQYPNYQTPFPSLVTKYPTKFPTRAPTQYPTPYPTRFPTTPPTTSGVNPNPALKCRDGSKPKCVVVKGGNVENGLCVLPFSYITSTNKIKWFNTAPSFEYVSSILDGLSFPSRQQVPYHRDRPTRSIGPVYGRMCPTKNKNFNPKTDLNWAKCEYRCANGDKIKEYWDSGPPPIRKKNVLLITVDDLNTVLPSYGDKVAKLPNFDRFAQMGFQFTNAHSQFPQCGPSRTSYLTGLRPSRTMHLNHLRHDTIPRVKEMYPSLRTIPEHFRENGYTTLGMGKVSHTQHEFAWEKDLTAWSRPVHDRFRFQAENLKKYWLWSDEKVAEDFHEDSKLARNANYTLHELAAAPDVPFFLALGFFAPHLPWMCSREHWDVYKNVTWKLRPDSRRTIPDQANALHEPTRSELGQYRKGPPGPNARNPPKLIEAYYACVRHIDNELGIILKAMDNLNLWNNTVVVLTSDHGFHLGDHNIFGKWSIFESDSRVPLIVVDPDLHVNRTGQESNAPVELVDLLPTLSDLSGLNYTGLNPQVMDGTSLGPILRGEKPYVKPFAITRRYQGTPTQPALAFRTMKYRFVLWGRKINIRSDKFSAKDVEVYDYSDDPGELRNQAKQLPEMVQYALKAANMNTEVWNQTKPFDWDQGLYGCCGGFTASFDRTQSNGPEKGPTLKHLCWCGTDDLPTSYPTRFPTVLTSYPTRFPTVPPTDYPTSYPSAPVPPTPPTEMPTSEPTTEPSAKRSAAPSAFPTSQPSLKPSEAPSSDPTAHPSFQPTEVPTEVSTLAPTQAPSSDPTAHPSSQPTEVPSEAPSSDPTAHPSFQPSDVPSDAPSPVPTSKPSFQPSEAPSEAPSSDPTAQPSFQPTEVPTAVPSAIPTSVPSANPTSTPTHQPSSSPTGNPSANPTSTPTHQPSSSPTAVPSANPTSIPTEQTTTAPTEQ